MGRVGIAQVGDDRFLALVRRGHRHDIDQAQAPDPVGEVRAQTGGDAPAGARQDPGLISEHRGSMPSRR
jgi:hypothetical protein